MARDITIAKDKNFKEIIPVESCTVDGEYLTYALDADADIGTVYVKAPVLYRSDSISRVSAAADRGNKVKLNNTEWFDIESIDDVTEDGVRTYTVNIKAVGNVDTSPRFPKLIVNGAELPGSTAITYDEDLNFKSGSFIFNLPVNLNLENVTLCVDDVLVKETNENSVTTVRK